MVKISERAEKTTPAKRIIEVSDIKLSEIKLVDETGDVTKDVLNELPDGIDTITIKITCELPSENTDEEE